jgi:signal peptidase I
MRKRAITGFGIVLLFVFGFTIFFYLNFNTVIVSGSSMLPTYKNGRRLLASRAYWLVGPIRDKDIVVIKGDGPSDYIIKRVYKMGGEVVDFANVPEQWTIAMGEFVVPTGNVYVLGDNREVSEDSRKFGPVPVDRILGKIVSY